MLLLLRGSLGWQGWCWEEVVVPAFVLGHPQGVVLDPWAGIRALGMWAALPASSGKRAQFWGLGLGL